LKRESQVSLNPDIKISVEKDLKSHHYILEIFIVYLFLGACNLTLIQIFNMPLGLISAMLGLLLPIGFTAIFSMKKYQKRTLIASLAFYAMMVFAFFDQIRTGLLILNLNVVETFNMYNNRSYNAAYVGVEAYDFDRYTNITMIAIAVLLSLLFTLLIVHSKNATFAGILALPFAYCAIELTYQPKGFILLLLLCAFTMAFAMQCICQKERGKKNGDYFKIKGKKKKKKYILYNSEIKNKMVAPSGFVILAIIIALSFTFQLIFPQGSYNKNAKPRKMLMNVGDTFENIGAGFLDGFGGFSGFGGKSSSGGIGKGKLGQVSQITFNNSVHLKITADIKCPMYLRGFSAGDYSDNEWKDLNTNFYESYSEVFDRFDRSSMSPLNIGNDYMKYLKESYEIEPFQQATVSITNISANGDYVYAPYYFTNTPKDFTRGEFVKDTHIKTRPFEKTYKFSSYFFDNFNGSGNTNLDYSQNLSPKFEEMLFWSDPDTDTYYDEFTNQMENEYSDFAKEAYTRLPEGQLEKLKETARSIVIESDSDALKINDIKNYLANTCQYSLTPGRTPKGEDFAEYFLFGNKLGVCSHFATAGTLMLRANGIPARYVEGYVVTRSDYPEGAVDSKTPTEISIKDTNAHAWVEVYTPKMGWIPVEMTPGFTDLNVNSQNTGETLPPLASSSTPSSSEAPSSQSSSSAPVSSATTSSTSTVSSTPVSSTPQVDKSAEVSNLSSLITFVVSVMLSLLLIFMVFVVNRLSRLFLYNRSVRKASKNKSAIIIYTLIKKKLLFLGYDVKKHSNESAFAIFVENESPLIEKGTLQNITEIALMARFSQHQITDSQLQTISNYSSRLSKSIYSSLSLHKKIVFKFIKAFI